MKKRTLGIVHLDLMAVLSLHGITDSSVQTITARPETPRKGLVERWCYRKKDVFTYLSLECYDIFVHNQSLSVQHQSDGVVCRYQQCYTYNSGHFSGLSMENHRKTNNAHLLDIGLQANVV